MTTEEKEQATQGVINASTQAMKSAWPVAMSAAFEQVLGKNADARAQKYYRENQAAMYRYGQMAQKNAASNEVEGLKKAGLSTALAGGTQGMSTAVAAMPHQNPKAVAANPEHALVSSNLALNVKQGALLDSETALNESRKDSVDIDNANKEGENLTYAAAYDSALAVMESDAQVAGDKVTLGLINALRQNKNIYRTRGDFEALQRVAAMAQASPAIMAQRIHDALNTAIDTAAANNPNWIAAQLIKPLLANDETRARISELTAATAKYLSDAENNKALLPKIKEETEWLGAQISHLNVETSKIANDDLVGAIKNGDWSTVGAHAVIGAADLAKDVTKTYVGAKTGGKALGEASQMLKGSPVSKKVSEHPLKAQPSKSLSKIPKSVSKRAEHFVKGPGSIINGKPYYMDKNGNWRPYMERKR